MITVMVIIMVIIRIIFIFSSIVVVVRAKVVPHGCQWQYVSNGLTLNYS